MRLFKMNKPQCLLYSAAMLLDIEPGVLIKEIGHDGMEIMWPDYVPPACFRSHHIQEIIDCFVARSFGLMPIEFEPMNAPSEQAKSCKPFKDNEARFHNHIDNNDAIMIGAYKGRAHAWAWCHKCKECYDPNGFITTLDDYKIMEAWIKVKMI